MATFELGAYSFFYPLHTKSSTPPSQDIPVSPAEVFELVEQLVRRACALPAEENPLQVDKLEIADYIFQLCQFNPPDNITLPAG